MNISPNFGQARVALGNQAAQSSKFGQQAHASHPIKFGFSSNSLDSGDIDAAGMADHRRKGPLAKVVARLKELL